MDGSETCLVGSEAYLAGSWALEGGTVERTDERTDERKISQFYRTSSPIGAAAQKGCIILIFLLPVSVNSIALPYLSHKARYDPVHWVTQSSQSVEILGSLVKSISNLLFDAMLLTKISSTS